MENYLRMLFRTRISFKIILHRSYFLFLIHHQILNKIIRKRLLPFFISKDNNLTLSKKNYWKLFKKIKIILLQNLKFLLKKDENNLNSDLLDEKFNINLIGENILNSKNRKSGKVIGYNNYFCNEIPIKIYKRNY